jgi:hypothetical protein
MTCLAFSVDSSGVPANIHTSAPPSAKAPIAIANIVVTDTPPVLPFVLPLDAGDVTTAGFTVTFCVGEDAAGSAGTALVSVVVDVSVLVASVEASPKPALI